ncbi:MAG: 2-hydroxychromene-2-carboxylate isomerase [Arenicella sp.]
MRLEFWFDFGSTYSYPAVMRVEKAIQAYAIDIHWRPFLLGAIFNDQGLNDSPFNIVKAKGDYMWRDMQRICDKANYAFRHPSVFPRNGLLAARVATMHENEEWVASFIQSIFRENFEFDRDISSNQVVSNCLDKLGLNADSIIKQALSQTSKDKLFEQTEEAKRKAIFGAPMFVVGEELFWGNDKLEEAVEWLLNQQN